MISCFLISDTAFCQLNGFLIIITWGTAAIKIHVRILKCCYGRVLKSLTQQDVHVGDLC